MQQEIDPDTNEIAAARKQSATDELESATMFADAMTRIVKPQLEMQSQFFDKAKAYSNLILAAGYAGYFGVWSLTRPFLARKQTMWVAGLLLISLTTFVLYEVLSMFAAASGVRKHAKTLLDVDRRGGPGIVDETIAAFVVTEEAQRLTAMRLGRLWLPVYFVTVGTGLAGAGTLIYCFIWQLVH